MTLTKEGQSIPKVHNTTNIELKAAMISLGFESKNATIFSMISDMDEDMDAANKIKDGSGQLEFAEWFHLMTAKPDTSNSKAHLKKLFDMFDIDKKDCISLDDLKRVAS